MARRLVRLPFVPVAPLAVLVVSLVTAAVVGWAGIVRLRQATDEAAGTRAALLAEALAARLQETAEERQDTLLQRAATRSGAGIVVTASDGGLIHSGTSVLPPREIRARWLDEREGLGDGPAGRCAFAARAFRSADDRREVLVWLGAPATPPGAQPLLGSVGLFALALTAAAALVALAVSRDIRDDVAWVERRIADMARARQRPTDERVPVRAADLTGQLTSELNELIGRFQAAEAAYRHDLERALRFDRDRADFLAALSHELRTPLNAILGFTDVLLSEVDGPLSVDARENLQQVRSGGDHLRALVDDILDLSALESGQLRLELQECNVFAIAADVVREAKVTAKGKPVAVQLAGQQARAVADPRRVRQILGNVVGNAVKFTSEGSVLVFVEGGPEEVTVTVEDTGPGIPREQQAAIFEEYRQAGPAKLQRAGTGLGLAITRRLIGMHGGRIELRSEVGAGARFLLAFPTQGPPPERRRDPSTSSVEGLFNDTSEVLDLVETLNPGEVEDRSR